MLHSPFYLDNAVGAHCRAKSAPDAGVFIDTFCRMMTFFVDLILGNGEYFFWTCGNA